MNEPDVLVDTVGVLKEMRTMMGLLHAMNNSVGGVIAVGELAAITDQINASLDHMGHPRRYGGGES